MAVLTALDTLHAGTDPFGFTNYVNLKADIDFLAVAGADLTAAATITVTNEMHTVSGTTPIQTINHAAPVKGQQVRLRFQTAGATILHTVGNIILRGGDLIVEAQTILTFQWNGVDTWYMMGDQAAAQLDYAQITTSPAAITASTEGTAVAIITGNAVNYAGRSVKVEVFIPKTVFNSGANPELRAVVFRGGTAIGQIPLNPYNGAAGITGAVYGALFDTPTGVITYSVKAFVTVAASSMSIVCGAGGAGAIVPAFLRVVKA